MPGQILQHLPCPQPILGGEGGGVVGGNALVTGGARAGVRARGRSGIEPRQGGEFVNPQGAVRGRRVKTTCAGVQACPRGCKRGASARRTG